jgi:hypothetical protein
MQHWGLAGHSSCSVACRGPQSHPAVVEASPVLTITQQASGDNALEVGQWQCRYCQEAQQQLPLGAHDRLCWDVVMPRLVDHRDQRTPVHVPVAVAVLLMHWAGHLLLGHPDNDIPANQSLLCCS